MNDVWSYGLHVENRTLPPGIVHVPYTAELRAKEGDAPFQWSLTFGSLPPGLTLGTPVGNTLPIHGTPTAVGHFNFGLRLQDADGNVIDEVIMLTINPTPKRAGEGASSGCATIPHPHLPLTTAIAAALYALARRRRLTRAT